MEGISHESAPWPVGRVSLPCLASAAPPDEKVLGELTGLPVEVSGDVAKVSKPRGDIHEVVDGRAAEAVPGPHLLGGVSNSRTGKRS